ncbi:hypothetical protein [Arthrobacter crystallopoietes]|uniref:Uncharacterized protein n=1 Tax=Crystallibacter crystallopoietes TaxID=37928 RepID=A0A1H1FYD5_9MICC|nr:hypothetical protein [Arthrobacter crystallopoietes]AUI52862.1 hypothetical protein AC20117_20755 [Arthrobacter crystallopoietes]SDR05910.1 hypothetical protein SAMN04489742_3723 [Arthrobacter crystallopoietes]
MEYLWVLAPSAGVGLIFYFAMKAVFNADRKEREALAAAERESDLRSRANRNDEAGPGSQV